MNRKEIARETLDIMEKGYYEMAGKRVEIQALQEHSVMGSFLLNPEQGAALLKEYEASTAKAAIPSSSQSSVASSASHTAIRVWNCSTVDAILKVSSHLKQSGNPSAGNSLPSAKNDIASTENGIASTENRHSIAVLNFASAKNPGGGFINGAMAQEESLAASSCLYKTQIAHEDYYKANRACPSMMYTDHAIYSPDVAFFRDGNFRLLPEPVTVSVLTLPAVNMGQVRLKKENEVQAKQVMRRRMKLALAIFARQNCRYLILGAYGCGVFRNDPSEVAAWWRELLEESFVDSFETVVFAVLDNSVSQTFITPFQNTFADR